MPLFVRKKKLETGPRKMMLPMLRRAPTQKLGFWEARRLRKAKMTEAQRMKRTAKILMGLAVSEYILEKLKVVEVPEKYKGYKDSALLATQIAVGAAGVWYGKEALREKKTLGTKRKELATQRRKYENAIWNYKQSYTPWGYSLSGAYASDEALMNLRQKEEEFVDAIHNGGNALVKELEAKQSIFKMFRKPETTETILMMIKKANPKYFKLVADYAHTLRVAGGPFRNAKEFEKIRSIDDALGRITHAARKLGYTPQAVDVKAVPQDLPSLMYSESLEKRLPRAPEERAREMTKAISAYFGAIVRGEKPARKMKREEALKIIEELEKKK